MIAAGDFLEWADVFGNLYGTSRADTERLLASGDDVVLVIDVQGARQVRSRGVVATTVFVMPPSADRARAAAARSQQGQRGRHSAAPRGRAGRKSPRLPSTISSSSTTSWTPPSNGSRASYSPSGPPGSHARHRRKHREDIFMIDRSKLPNSFEFVVTAGARARQLLAGSTPRVAVGDHKKTTVAQQEVVTKRSKRSDTSESGN